MNRKTRTIPIETLPEAVIMRALRDLSHPYRRTARDAFLWFLSGGNFWQHLTTIDIKELYFQYVSGEFDITKIYKEQVTHGTRTRPRNGQKI